MNEETEKAVLEEKQRQSRLRQTFTNMILLKIIEAGFTDKQNAIRLLDESWREAKALEGLPDNGRLF